MINAVPASTYWAGEQRGGEEVGSATGVHVCVRAKSLQFCPSLWNTTDRSPPGKNTGVGCRALLQGIFPSQGSNLHLLCLLNWQEGSLPLAPPAAARKPQFLLPTPVLLPGKSHERRSLVGSSMRSLRVGHDWETSLSLFTFMHWRRKWQPTPVFLPGEYQGQRSLVGCCLWGRTEVGHNWRDLAAAAAKDKRIRERPVLEDYQGKPYKQK